MEAKSIIAIALVLFIVGCAAFMLIRRRSK